MKNTFLVDESFGKSTRQSLTKILNSIAVEVTCSDGSRPLLCIKKDKEGRKRHYVIEVDSENDWEVNVPRNISRRWKYEKSEEGGVLTGINGTVTKNRLEYSFHIS